MTSTFRCTECGHVAPRWFGRCPECGGWSSAQQSGPTEPARVAALPAALDAAERFSTGLSEVDRVLGGGLVPGAVVLLAGEPGIGKSTLLLQLVEGLAAGGRRALYVSGEETLAQVGARAKRLGVSPGRCSATTTTDVGAVVGAARAEGPDVVIVDSIQTLIDPAVDHSPGAPLQLRHCAQALVELAKSMGVTVVVTGHVTKDGNVAGPKVLEHMVDAVITLEGDRTGVLRLLRASKNRFGPCDETGVFAMKTSGLEAVGDPSALLLADRPVGAAGSIVVAAMEGSRPVLVEIQALVARSGLPQPRRVAIGVEPRRLTLLLAVLAKNGFAAAADHDVFVAATGGIAVREPAADLAIALALWSALEGEPVGDDLVAMGELGLAGEVRRVPHVERRASEAARHGFARAIVPRGSPDCPGIALDRTATIAHAVAATFAHRAEEARAS